MGYFGYDNSGGLEDLKALLNEKRAAGGIQPMPVTPTPTSEMPLEAPMAPPTQQVPGMSPEEMRLLENQQQIMRNKEHSLADPNQDQDMTLQDLIRARLAQRQS